MAVYGAPETHDGVVAEVDGELTGAVTYVRDGDSWEVVTVIATVEGAGIGRAMLEEVRRLAQRSRAGAAPAARDPKGDPTIRGESAPVTTARTCRVVLGGPCLSRD